MTENNTHLANAIRASLLAGQEILGVYHSGDFSVDMKSDDSPLTQADLQSHNCIVSILEGDIPILSEEGRDMPYSERSAWSDLWIVDPLDGTKEFIKRNGEFTVNIALISNQRPILGVIYVPVKDQLYFGHTGGSYLVEDAFEKIDMTLEELMEEAKPLPDGDLPKSYTIVASRSHMSPETEAFVDEMKAQHGDVNTVSMGSSLKICLVAEGKAHVYPRYAPTMEWDTAAGHAIAIGAGKELYDYKTNEPMKYNREELLNNWFTVK